MTHSVAPTWFRTILALSLVIALPAIGRSQSDLGSTPFEMTDAQVLSSGIGFQGRLLDNGSPASALYDFEVKLYDAVVLGSQIGSTVTLGDQAVVNGLFTVELDFGNSVFGGDPRWAQIGVRPGASVGAYEVLTPRTKISSTPQSLSLPNVFTDPSTNFVGIGRNFRVSGNEVFGLRYTGGANQYGGMYVETSDAAGLPFYGFATNGSFRAWTYYHGDSGIWRLYNAGMRLSVPATGGLRIGNALDYSLVIENTTGSDGIRILDTGDDGIQIGSNPDIPNYGVYIPSPGVATYGLWSNTQNASGEWALYTVDNIQAGNVAAAAFSLVARVSGSEALGIGDLVTVEGLENPFPGANSRLPKVRLAQSASYAGIIGVVGKRMVLKQAPGKDVEGETSLQSEPGPAVKGDYVSLIVYGVADVRIDASAGIEAGQRLTASDVPGQARALRTRTVEGMAVAENAPSIGIALEAPVAGAGTIPVFVTLK